MSAETLRKKLNDGYRLNDFTKMMGLYVEKFDEDRAVLRVDCNEKTMSRYGTLYGGVVSFAADVALWNALLTRGEHPRVVTTDLNVHYLDRFPEGHATIDARVLRYGKRLIICEAEMYNSKKVLAAHITGTFMNLGNQDSFDEALNPEDDGNG